MRQTGWKGRDKRRRTNRAESRYNNDKPYIDRDLAIINASHVVHDEISCRCYIPRATRSRVLLTLHRSIEYIMVHNRGT